MMQPLVSVIVTFYNRAELATATLATISNQTLTDFELICIDDGSTDTIPEVLAQYAQHEPRMKIFRYPHTNAGVARNYGLQHSQGKYIFFLDADDWFAPDFLQKMVTTLEQEQSDVVICQTQEFDHATGQDGRLWSWRGIKLTKPIQTFNLAKIRPHLFTFSYAVVWNRIFKRELLQKYHLQFQDIPRNNDLYFSLAYLLSCRRITILDEVLLRYRVHDLRSVTHYDEHILSYCQAMDYLRAQLPLRTMRHITKPYYLRYLQVTLSKIKHATQMASGAMIFHHVRQLLSQIPATVTRQLPPALQFYWQCLQNNDWQKLWGKYHPGPQVSIIMPFYNRADLIPATLDSILNQTFRDFELLCVDDGSTDAVPQILQTYAQKDARIQIIRKRHTNVSDARNLAYEASTGAYLFFLDSDDLFAPDFLEKMLQAIKQEDSDLVVCKYDKFDHRTREVFPDGDFEAITLTQPLTTLPRAAFRDHIFQMTHDVVWNKILCRRLIAAHHLRFWDNPSDDMLFSCLYLAHCQKITLLDTVLVHHRVHETRSIMTKLQNHFVRCLAVDQIRTQLPAPLFNELQPSFYQKYLAITLHCLKKSAPRYHHQILRHAAAKLRDYDFPVPYLSHRFLKTCLRYREYQICSRVIQECLAHNFISH